MSNWIMGVDPGLSGGVAIISLDGSVYAAHKFTGLTLHDIRDKIKEFAFDVKLCFFELVHSMPKQGVSSTFKFGKITGYLEGIIACQELRVEHVSPGVWQRQMKCLSRGDKKVTRARAQELFPRLQITHAIADALLIAEYGRRVYNSGRV